MNKIIPSPAVRAWIYGILVAAAAVGVGYGVITAEQGNLWLAFAAAVLGLSNGLALVNTPKGRHSASSGEDGGA